MKKFLILYNSNISARQLMAQSSPEQVKASMQEWISWKAEATKTVKFEFGMPLQAADHITPQSVTVSDNQASGYSMMEAETREMVTEALKSHPHLKHEGASIDVLEIISMPGM